MKEFTIIVKSSLHSRPSAIFVQTASKYKSNIFIKIDDKVVNAKSIMGIISLGILSGQQVTIVAEGEDEDEAISSLQKFFETT